METSVSGTSSDGTRCSEECVVLVACLMESFVIESFYKHHDVCASDFCAGFRCSGA